MYVETFTLPIDKELALLRKRAEHNGGKAGYIDNPYPCGLFSRKGFSEIYFRNITILPFISSMIWYSHLVQ